LNKSCLSRRKFVDQIFKSGAALTGLGALNCNNYQSTSPQQIRQYHLSLASHAWEEIPDLPSIVSAAGITHVWLAAFLYGSWYRSPKELSSTARYLENKGLKVHIINVPLGHPGDALGADNEDVSTTPPSHWQNACTVDGQLYSGTSIHSPAIKENSEAMIALQKEGFDTVFLDDDFRIAQSPGIIGGCFCDNCQKEFMSIHGYATSEWAVLIDSVKSRNPSPVLRAWVNYGCDKLWGMFTALQKAAPEIQLGNMIMYLGAEKAGIALDKFRNVPFRVGELMFSDREFNRIKGKTDELFSSLFHRRFAAPELAFSETTAFPAHSLSANNMAAKLAVSLISDVRKTMFMSGLKPFPIGHWETLGPAMRKSALIHEKIAGHQPQGPFKHFWGMDSRLVGKDRPFSLFLASGIPFQVVEDIPADGWVFLSNEDAKAAAKGRILEKGRNLVVRPEAGVSGENIIPISEKMRDIFDFKQSVISTLKGVPYVQGEQPAVFVWYPSARAALLWNVEEKLQTFVIKRDDQIVRTVTVGPLDVALVENI
jgi:hypothetical protein